MIPFLKSVALAYARRYADLSKVLFLFPNKRAGTFFLKYLKETACGHPVIAPDVMPVADFASELSGLVVTDRLNAVFLLYDCYRRIRGGDAADAETMSEEFEKFISWGDVILSDFSEIDLYLADADEVFGNIRDYREISADFLTDEQKTIMREYFGREDTSGAVAGFWKDFYTPDSESPLKKRFIYLWQIMSPLYHELLTRLRKQGLSTVGGNYRAALECLKANGREHLPWRKIVAVGFNALSTVEASIFRVLSSFEPYEGYDGAFMDFLWDGTGPVLDSGSNSASKFLRANRKAFPSPEWALPVIAESDTDSMPEIMTVGSCPSNVAQAKIAGRILSGLKSRLPGNDFKDARVAVVLPDESLLMPLLYSIPPEITDINLTMGYSLKLTAVSSFMRLMRMTGQSARTRRGEEDLFFRRPLKRMLAHPIAMAYAGRKNIDAVVNYIDSFNEVEVCMSEIERMSTDVPRLLAPVVAGNHGGNILQSLDRLLGEIYDRMGEASSAPLLKSRLEREHVVLYRDALRRLSDVVSLYEVPLTPSAMFMLADRLLAGEKVQFEGEPLSGLQVMGTLETRALDFDCIVIPSMNERIMPMRMRVRTFIPDSLRRGYGLPPSNYAESLFAYYFYRMISRASEVRMLYDARSSAGMRAGDISRYILQLRYLFAPGKLQEENWSFSLKKTDLAREDIAKTPEILEKLGEYLDPESGKGLSASTLDSYRQCQARFFYETVMGVNTDPEPSEYIDAIMQGDIIHQVLQDVYLPKESQGILLLPPREITRGFLEELLSDAGKERLWHLMTRTVNVLYGHLSGERLDTPLEGVAEIVSRNLLRQVIGTLRKDLALASFYLYGVEISEKFSLPVGEGLDVNFKCKIDRLDSVEIDGERVIRIVDYKTGSIHMKLDEPGDLFDTEFSRKTVFQLFLYGWLLNRMERWPERPEKVRTEIYHLAGIFRPDVNIPEIGGRKVTDYNLCDEEFDNGLKKLVTSIFDPDIPFVLSKDLKKCTFCPLMQICRR